MNKEDWDHDYVTLCLYCRFIMLLFPRQGLHLTCISELVLFCPTLDLCIAAVLILRSP